MNRVIQHREFGTIEWNEEMKRWSGRVLLDYFSTFDMKAQAACAERLGRPLKPIILDEGRQDKAVELSLIMTGSGEPTARQERAYNDFVTDRDRVPSTRSSISTEAIGGGGGSGERSDPCQRSFTPTTC